MKRLTIILAISLALFASKANATNLRGQIVHTVGGVYQPLPNTRVDLMTWNGGAWVSYAYTVTGADGFYYFMNFPAGTRFCLLVSGHYYPPQALVIQNIAVPAYQDLPVISI